MLINKKIIDLNNKNLDEDIVVDENGNEISPLDDDYEFWKVENERLTNPLSNDYCKYNRE